MEKEKSVREWKNGKETFAKQLLWIMIENERFLFLNVCHNHFPFYMCDQLRKRSEYWKSNFFGGGYCCSSFCFM